MIHLNFGTAIREGWGGSDRTVWAVEAIRRAGRWLATPAPRAPVPHRGGNSVSASMPRRGIQEGENSLIR